MAAPIPKVEMAFGYGPLDVVGAGAWTDVTTYAREVSVRRGRQFELDRFEAGTCDVVLEDEDRRFDPTNTASPYHPYVRPMVPLRITHSHLGTDYRRFYGFVEAWPQSWAGGGDPRSTFVEVRAVDLFKLLAMRTLRSPYAEAILADAPVAYFRMDDVGSSMVDSSGNARLATHFGGSSEPAAAVLDEGTAWSYDGSNADLIWNGVGIEARSFAAECWFKTSDQKTQSLFESGDTDAYAIQCLVVSGQPTFAVRNREGTIDTFVASPNDFADGAWHHLVGMYDDTTRVVSLYVDTLLQASATAPAPINFRSAPFVVGHRFESGGGTSTRFVGSIDELAFYGATLSAAQRSAHHAARALRSGELSGARVSHILDRLSPALPRSVDAGRSSLGPAYGFASQSMLEALQLVAESEGGAFFMSGDGSACFFDRHDRITPPKNIPQALLGDGGGTEIDYESVDLSYDDERIFNDVRVSNSTGTIASVSDDASASAYGRRTLELTVELTDDNATYDRAYWALARYRQPAMRCEQVAFGPVFDDVAWTALLSREVSDRVRVIRRPRSGGALTQDCFVESVEERIDATGTTLTFQLSPASDHDAWIVGDAAFGVLDQTTRLGY